MVERLPVKGIVRLFSVVLIVKDRHGFQLSIMEVFIMIGNVKQLSIL